MKASLQILTLIISAMFLTACAEKNFDAQSPSAASAAPVSSSSLPSLGASDSGSSGSVLNPPALGSTGGTSTVPAGSTVNTPSAPSPTERIEQFVSELYWNMFQRRQDSAGNLYWVASYRRGEIGCRALTLNFLLSQEAAPIRSRADSDRVARSEYIVLLYLAVLNRPADQSGYNYWLNDSTSAARMEQLFLDSSEFRARCQNYGLRY